MIKGIDSSHYNPDLDYNQAKKDGYEFIMMKATEGKTYQDPKFGERLPKAKESGLLTGAYGFSRPGSNKPEEEAAALLSQIKAVGGVDLPPMLDMEDNGGLSDADLQKFCTSWREEIQKTDKRKPILYVNVNFYNKLKPIVKDFVLWLAEYGVKEPQIKEYSFWQFSDSEAIQGGKFDGDTFNGSLDDLQALCEIQPKKEDPKVAVPQSSKKSQREIVMIKEGDTLSKIALMKHIPLQVLARFNHIADPNTIKAGNHLRIPQVVEVRSGDTVSQYAYESHETTSFLGYVNNLNNVNQISVGQTLYI